MVIDIPNLFIQTRVNEKKYMAIINIREVLVDTLLTISSDYNVYVTRQSRGVKQFMLCFQSALYETMAASLIDYCNFTKNLTKMKFVINPYDPCVSNKVINGSQMKI